jgi:hypothetical protein
MIWITINAPMTFAKSFTAAFGPTHFSYNIGEVHYVVLKNVFFYVSQIITLAI